MLTLNKPRLIVRRGTTLKFSQPSTTTFLDNLLRSQSFSRTTFAITILSSERVFGVNFKARPRRRPLLLFVGVF